MGLKLTLRATRALTGAVLLTASCAADLGPAQAPANPSGQARTSADQGMIEGPFFHEFGRYAHRIDGKTVALTLRDGSEVSIGSENDCLFEEDEHWSADCVTKTPVFYFARRGFFLFQATRYEGGGWLLVSDRDGHETSLPAPPHFSPDGASFVVATGPGGPSYKPNSVEIWAVRDGTPMRVFHHSVTIDDPDWFWGYEFVAWRGPDRVEFTYLTGQQGVSPRAAYAIRQGSRWSIVTDPAAPPSR